MNWLGEPSLAFTACIVTNVWLGYPFMMVIATGSLYSLQKTRATESVYT